ncbi:MAG TPA: valine--tRNA ligase [Phycisphaerales bacterium]|nr:valine--tRNA ligase [Phycisphaerales bacterium]
MSEQLSKIYEPETIERQANEIWSSNSYFHAEPQVDGENKGAYTIVIPPPNVTAPLHLGHALNNTLQDILIRFRRMQNYNTLWMPGTDHAGIATQTVVEKRILSEEGKRRTDFERDEFVGRVQAWKDEYEARIIEQLKAMGCSCDWERTRFTMDEMCVKAVRSAFFKLFKDRLIYRGKRLVNWDPATQTVLADDEVEHETVQGHFWYMRYPLVEPVKCVAGVPPARIEGVPPSQQDSKSAIDKRQGRYLPHWSKQGATYAVTFWLADAVPGEVSESWRLERQQVIEQAQLQERPLTYLERIELHRLYSEKIESFLDAGHGQCILRDPQLAEILQNALKHFDGERYELVAWAVMPNHVHAIVRPLAGHELPKIVHSWKSFTSKQVNLQLNRKGTLWMDEYYDHLIRDEGDFRNQVDYVLANPEKANMQDWPWCGMGGAMSDQERGQDALETRGRDARDTATITHVTVATTRPETMLGDTAVAMNPNDPRAKYLVGKKVRLPIVGREIPIIADEHVVLPDPNSEDEKAKFSTGFLKVTPAHDPDDWAIGERHGLEVINVMAPDGSISDKYGWEDVREPEAQSLLGMDRFEAREAIVEWFRKEKLLEDVREYVHEVGHSYRSHVPIEPYLSDQWYIAVKKPIEHLADKFGSGLIEGTDVPVNSLAGLALKPLLDGRLRFTPERYAKTYQTWLENLRDWPISRQLWWGHRIPIWSIELTKAGALDPDKPDSLLDERIKNDFENTFSKFVQKCGLQDEICFKSKWNEIEERWIYYICTKNIKADTALKSLKNIFSQKGSPGISIEQIEEYKKDDDLFKDKYGKDTYNQIGQLKSSIGSVNPIQQDEDVLDTWFSSALWPFSTMGWPEDTPELKTFYPGDVLCTAREIITLWVSRMLMMGQYCAGDIPFSDVYIHAMIQDGQGRKMSKSLGNGIDPLVAIDSHGADAMRFTLASMATDTQDIRMPVAAMTLPDGRQANTSPKFDIGRNFCNKLWNASRFAMMNLEGIDPAGFDPDELDITDRWILSRLMYTVEETTRSLDEFKYSEPLSMLYKFFWNDFCDWYLEWIKPRMQDERKRPIAQNVLAFVLDQTLRLLHPFIPFITEGIFQKLNEIAPVRRLEGLMEAKNADGLVIAEWPQKVDSLKDANAEKQIDVIQTVIRTVRDIRSNRNIPPKEPLVVSVKSQRQTVEVLNRNAELICQLAGVKEFQAGTDIVKPVNAAVSIADVTEVYVHEAIDPQIEQRRFEKQKQQIEKAKESVEAKLANENFVTKAKPEVVAQAKVRLAQLIEQLKTVEEHLSELKNNG